MAYTAKDPCPPHNFLYLTETKSWRCEYKGKGENVHLLTHAPARGVGKKLSQDAATYKLNWFDCIYEWSLLQHREVLQYHSHLLLRYERKQDRITAKDQCPHSIFCTQEKQKLGGVEKKKGEKVSQLTHTTARGMGK